MPLAGLQAVSGRPEAEGIDENWSGGFMSDGLFVKGRNKSLAIADNIARESLVIRVEASTRGQGVVGFLHQLIEQRRWSMTIRVDHGPEFTSRWLGIRPT